MCGDGCLLDILWDHLQYIQMSNYYIVYIEANIMLYPLYFSFKNLEDKNEREVYF